VNQVADEVDQVANLEDVVKNDLGVIQVFPDGVDQAVHFYFLSRRNCRRSSSRSAGESGLPVSREALIVRTSFRLLPPLGFSPPRRSSAHIGDVELTSGPDTLASCKGGAFLARASKSVPTPSPFWLQSVVGT
jgi:hypothetical protein